MHILNAPTRLMKDLGYGKGYEYDHDAEEGFSGQNYFPDGMERRRFYAPVETCFEREIRTRLDYWRSEAQTSELQSLMRSTYSAFCSIKERTFYLSYSSTL